MRKPPSEIFGMPVRELSRLCGVDISTARRWKRGATCPPESALLILRRHLGLFAPEWCGWTINGRDLVCPEGWCVNRNDALIVPLMHGQISALRSQIETLKAEAAGDMRNNPSRTPTRFISWVRAVKHDIGAFFFALITVAVLALMLKVCAGRSCSPSSIPGSCIGAEHWEVH